MVADFQMMKALLPHVPVDHNHKCFDNECSLALSKASSQLSLTIVISSQYGIYSSDVFLRSISLSHCYALHDIFYR